MNIVKQFIVLAFCLILSAGLSYAGDEDIKTKGYITSLTESEVAVNGVVYQLDSQTEYEDIDDSEINRDDFALGDFVEAKGFNLEGLLIARELSKESLGDDDSGDDIDSPVIVRGIIVDYSISAISVGDTTFAINENTKFEGQDDTPAEASDFAIGDIAKVKGYADSQGDLVATEIEAEDDLKDGSDDDSTSNRPQQQEIKLYCQLPNLKTVQDGIERAVLQALKEAGYSRASVSLKARIVQKDSPQKVSPIAAVSGVTVAINSLNTSTPVEIGGSIELQECTALVALRLKVRGFNPTTGIRVNTETSAELQAKGLYNRRERRKGGN